MLLTCRDNPWRVDTRQLLYLVTGSPLLFQRYEVVVHEVHIMGHVEGASEEVTREVHLQKAYTFRGEGNVPPDQRYIRHQSEMRVCNKRERTFDAWNDRATDFQPAKWSEKRDTTSKKY